MKILRKNCIRCGEAMQPANIDQEEMLFTCPACDSLSSAFEERDLVEYHKKIIQPDGINYEYLGSDLHIYLGELPSGEMQRSVIGIGILLIIFIAIFAMTGSKTLLLLTVILGTIGWMLNLSAYYRIDNRTYEIELNPYQVRFTEKLFGIKRQLQEVGSFEVDRIQIQTSPNLGMPGKNKTSFIIQTKQYQQIQPFYHSSGREAQLTYLKLLMDMYLNIQERKSDVQA